MDRYYSAVIYQLGWNGHPAVYVGSTIQTLKHRLQRHKSDIVHKRCSDKVAAHSALYGVPDIALMESYPCQSEGELRKRETWHIQQVPLYLSLNSQTAGSKDAVGGIVYALCSDQCDKVYIGSTVQSARTRMNQHRSRSQNTKYCKRRVYQHFNAVGWKTVTLDVLEDVANCTPQKLREAESVWQQRFASRLVNTANAIAGDASEKKRKAYCQAYHQKPHVQMKLAASREAIRAASRVRYAANIEAARARSRKKDATEASKNRRKMYREKHRQRINANARRWYNEKRKR